MNTNIKQQLTTVTTFSKIVAGILFIALPFIGFYLGMQYTKSINLLSQLPVSTVMPSPTPQPTACTQEAKVCPDGSSVGRTGPNCEFTACPVVGNIASDWKSYTSKPFGFSVMYPQGWKIDDSQPLSVMFTKPNGVSDKYSCAFFVSFYSNSQSKTISKLANEYFGGVSGVGLMDNGGTVHGKQYVKVVYTSRPGSTNYFVGNDMDKNKYLINTQTDTLGIYDREKGRWSELSKSVYKKDCDDIYTQMFSTFKPAQ
jgi:hypothetical protein